MRKLATVENILSLSQIEGADRIELAKVRGWSVVVKKGDFKVGDLCVYFEIDSFLPVTEPYLFLEKGTKPKTFTVDGKDVSGFRLKTIRLRGQISQGLALPLSVFTEGILMEKYEPGTDVTDLLGVIKYDPPIPASMGGNVKGSFPGFLKKTDEERIQNCGYVLEKYSKVPFYITCKVDGTSITYYRGKDGDFGVCGRNWELAESDSTPWKIADELNLKEILPNGFAVQGEMAGPGIQGNPHKLSKVMFFAFNMFSIEEQAYMDFPQLLAWCNTHSIQMVPFFGNALLPETVAEVLEMAQKNHPTFVNQEGLVFRPVKEIIDEKLGRLSFKAISNKYLLETEQ